MYHPLRFATPGLLRFARLIDTERQAQLAKWGDQHHRNGSSTSTNVRLCTDLAQAMRQVNADPAELSWTTIMLEEAYEVGAETDPAKIRAELIQLAAVCAAWIADIDSQPRACAHCGDPITGEGITWSGPMPKPGEDEYLVPRYHLSRDYPDCRRAAGHTAPVTDTGRKFGKTAAMDAVRQAAIDDGAHVHTTSAEAGTRCDTGDCDTVSEREV
ncbi:hypothetical protein ABTZ57_01295 [Streptomyces sp. NPDC094048]|uniref:hypothetical protein n=1 Tax=unclassified Streptomyces TaxID=2593676 RepID=UPI00332758B2